MRTSFMLLAGAAGLALSAGVAHAQATYSWGDSTTTYFYSPGTSDSYSPSAPPAAIPPAQIEAPPVPAQPDPSFYQAPDSYGIYRRIPRYDGAMTFERPHYFYADEPQNLGQGSGIDDRFGR